MRAGGLLLKLSIIVPLAPGETSHEALLRDLPFSLPPFLRGRPAGRTLQTTEKGREGEGEAFSEVILATPERFGKGRAKQMNGAAAEAKGEFLWFLHADSRLSEDAVPRLLDALDAAPDALHYFDLSFGDGSPLMGLNALGVWFRSRVLHLPFGDQGLCLARETFDRLGGFPEDAPYGEDHLLVWRALRAGVPVLPVGATVTTSARKYQSKGWLKTTLRHQFLTYKQALPQLYLLLRRKRAKR